MLKEFLVNIAFIFLLLQFFRGVVELFALRQSLRWLYQNSRMLNEDGKNKGMLPFFFILLPVLREQKVLEQTVNNFLVMNYPKDRYKIVIITTQKEIYEKERNKKKLICLADDLASGLNQNSLIEKHLGLFDEPNLIKLSRKYSKRDSSLIYKLISYDFDNYLTTIELAKNIQIKNKKIIDVVHYPYNKGSMADQINFTVKILEKTKIDKGSYIALYNADSNPNGNTLKFVANIINNSREQKMVLQQSAIFTKNFSSLGNSMRSFILKAGGLFQTRWTLCQEIPRIRKQFNSVNKIKLARSKLRIFLSARLAHCVGHGMFIDFSLFKELEYFPTKTVNEDLPFGFNVCVKNISIVPVPVLESADTPETIRHLINQKKVWFWSYLDYFKCRRMAIQKNISSHALINSLTLQGLWNGFWWLIGSVLFFWPIIISLIYLENYLIIISVLFLIIFHFFPSTIILLNFRRIHDIADQKSPHILFYEYFLIPFLGLFILFTDSVGPWLAVIDKVKFLLTGNMPYKQKTER